MALNINGTTGISGVDGSASAPAVTGTDSNTGINFGSDTVNMNTGGVTRATVNSAGNVGIGTTSPSAPSGTVLEIKGSSVSRLKLSNDTTGTGTTDGFQIYTSNNVAILENKENAEMRFYTNASEKMRVHSGGQVSIGHTTTNTTSNGMLFVPNGTSGFYTGGAHALHIGRGSNDGQVIRFNRSGTDCGSISVTTSSTSYNTSSDYRLKENVKAISDGITRLKTLKPYRFNFISEPKKTVDGFFAHEVTAVPEAIIGVKDEVDEDNKPVHQGIDQSKLVPLLTAALQEAIAKIEVLETKVAALEAA